MDPLKKLGSLEPARKAFSFWEEFNNFAFKGNVIDLVVGVIIGTAFGKIIESLVKNIIMPLVGLVLPGDQSYAKWGFDVEGKTVPVGAFIADVVNFLILALVLFIFTVKFLGGLMLAKRVEAAAPTPLTRDQELLTEIRDLLSKATVSAGEGK
jgi:large conductance mechanosensitive channel